MKKLSKLLAQTAHSLESFQHPRVSVAWQDLDLVYRHVYNPSPDLGQDIVGKRLEDVIDNPEQARQLNQIKREVIQSGQPYQEHVEVGLGRQQHYFDLTIEPTYNEHGTMDGLVSVNIDITDLMQAKQQLAEANERLVRILDETLELKPRGATRANVRNRAV